MNIDQRQQDKQHQKTWLVVLLSGLIFLLVSVPQSEARPAKGSPAREQMRSFQRELGRRSSQHPYLGQQARRSYPLAEKNQAISLSAAHVLSAIHTLETRFREYSSDPCTLRPTITTLLPETSRYPIYRIHIPATGKPGRSRGKKPVRVLVSSWIHGNEPVGPAAALKLVDLALRKKNLRRDFDLTVLIKVDRFGTRETLDGINFNRAFQQGKWTQETRTMANDLDGKQYDLFLDLHGDDEQPGFFLIWEADRAKVTGRALSALKTSALLDASPLHPWVPDPEDGYHMHMLGAGTTEDTAGCFDRFMALKRTPYSYTVEAPGRLPPQLQVRGMLKLIHSTMYNVLHHGKLFNRAASQLTDDKLGEQRLRPGE